MSMTFIEAAEKVLAEEPGGGPLHFREICQRALDARYLESKGKTPHQSMGAQLYTTIINDEDAGRPPRFVQAGKGLFSIARKK